MGKRAIIVLLTLFAVKAYSQTETFPYDFRQHNLLMVNPKMFNPVFALDQTNQHEIGYWSRWQWQKIDNTPTTSITDYSLRIGNLATGIGYFKNTTSVFRQRGINLNLAYAIPLADQWSLRIGTNLFTYLQDREYRLLFRTNPALGFQRDLIVRFAPAAQLKYNDFGVSFGYDNYPDFSLQRIGSEFNRDSKSYQIVADYTFNLNESHASNQKTLRPLMYVKRVYGFSTQVGINTVYSSGGSWLQAGLNSYYGASFGFGLEMSPGFSLGGVFEKDKSLVMQEDTKNYTLELMAKFSFGQDGAKRGHKTNKQSEDTKGQGQEQVTQVATPEEKTTQANLAELAAAMEAERNRAAAERKSDSIRMSQMLANQQKIIDSLKQVQIVAVESGATVGTGRVYQEVAAEEGLDSGYYVIANVFETERYLNAFMEDLRKLGIASKSFYRRANGYNYVYLNRFGSFSEANQARATQIESGYPGELWIFRIR
ncbi:MAG: hypothetical protein RLZZ241_2410 [Bacteroidota bacterium]|jgi:type IX secretion system PorP/SprF family membrane protein